MVTGTNASRAFGGVEEAGYFLDVRPTDEVLDGGGKDVGDEVGEVFQ